MKIKSEIFRKIKNAISYRWISFLDVPDIYQRALTEREHRKRSDKIKKIILPFVADKKRFIFLAEALQGYFDFMRAIELKNLIDDADITITTTLNSTKVLIYHKFIKV